MKTPKRQVEFEFHQLPDRVFSYMLPARTPCGVVYPAPHVVAYWPMGTGWKGKAVALAIPLGRHRRVSAETLALRLHLRFLRGHRSIWLNRLSIAFHAPDGKGGTKFQIMP